MNVKYYCCVCDEEMTAQVHSECSALPDNRVLMVQIKGMQLVHSSHNVQLTCPNGHTCNYPCVRGSNGEA
jgi:hypothetical protein